jgi:phage terminase large subunit-like protein
MTSELRYAMVAGLEAAKYRPPTWRPLPHQVPPPGDWYGWLLLAGRFSGKTDACAAYMCEHVKGPPCLPGQRHPHRMAIVAPTQNDAAYSCFTGPSGIQAHDHEAVKVTTSDGTLVRWPNGAYAKLFGADTDNAVDKFRAGGNNCLVWAEEIAAWPKLDAAWAQMRFGLRIGPRPRWVGSTTPKPRELIKRLDKGHYRNVVVTRATSRDNPYIHPDVLTGLMDDYGGTALAEQEIEGKIVEQDENALWRRSDLAAGRIAWADLPKLDRVTVGVDPSGGAGEQGIVAVAKAMVKTEDRLLAHGYVLADRSCRLSPDGWGARAVEAAVEFEAEDITVESDYGRDMPIAVLNGAVAEAGLSVPVRPTRARQLGGKRVRAFPVAALSRNGRWHHVGDANDFVDLEDQMCVWTEDAGWSPDRIDAAAWAAWHLGLVSTEPRGPMRIGNVAQRVIA